MVEKDRNRYWRLEYMNTWFITGSSSGIGAGIAQAALELGDNVVVMARKVESLDQFVKNIQPECWHFR